MRLIIIGGHLFIVAILTVITQVGGLIWIVSLVFSKKMNWKKRYSFPIIYLLFNLILIPIIAPFFGRVQLPVFVSNIQPQNYFYPLAFRNYVTPELRKQLIDASEDLARQGIEIDYLDANFPFIDGYPLLPHLSHNDGKKVDIAFQYKTKNGEATNKKPSLFGYGNYVNSENATNDYCKFNGHWQYDITEYLNIRIRDDLAFDRERTKSLVHKILQHSNGGILFIEPYLKKELGLQNNNQVRFHGCHAVRHDDHIHLQIR